MSHDTYKKLKTQWDKFKSFIDIADIAFIVLRFIILCGGIGWLLFAGISQKTFGDVSNLFISFFVYSVLIYLWLFLSPEKKRIIHVFLLFFDFLFTSLLVRLTGGFDSHFLNGFYIMTALYSFYYGLIPGAVIATIASVLYLVSGKFDFNEHNWADFSVSLAFLFFLAIPLGLLSQKFKGDEKEITNLNKDLKKYIEELQKVHGRLLQVEKMSALGRMAADVAHEIRNPLTSIGGFARRLEKKISQIKNEEECIKIISKERKHAEIITSEVNRLERVLGEVLTFANEIKYNLEYQEINGIIKESLKTFVDICKEHSIQIEEKLNASLPEILIDKDQIRQAVNNLISNAVGSMPEGGKIQIKTFMEELYNVNYVVAEVVDTGHGIQEDKITMIFEPFYSSREIGGGTGLGLSICKKIIDEHNGLIKVKSELGKGTSFKLLFPYQSEEEGSKMKCWEFHKCGMEKTEGAAHLKCPSYHNYGRICWVVAGTFCGGKVSGAIAQKLGYCQKCEFYKRVVVSKDL
ncbi:MAG: ATP-binding protein [Nitrospirota bacterium]